MRSGIPPVVWPPIGADGRYVAYDSGTLSGDQTQPSDVFVYDRTTRTTERLSVDPAGNSGNGPSFHPTISGDGRIVAFMSYASNLAPGDTGGTLSVRTIVHDRITGRNERVPGLFASLSGDGRYLAFAATDIFLLDRVTRSVQLVSADNSGNPAGDDIFTSDTGSPAVSGDGHTVAFKSAASNLLPDNVATQVFVATSCSPPVCGGDCNADGVVTVDEILTGVSVALGDAPVERCPSLDSDGNGTVSIDEILTAVNVALKGCDLSTSNPIPYRLLFENSITPPDSGNPPRQETLGGTFVVLLEQPPLPPGTLFAFRITTLRLRSGAFYGTEYAIDGAEGSIVAVSTGDTALSFRASVSINGQPVELSGVGSPNIFSSDPHPKIQGLTVTGGGYTLTVSAYPEI